MRGRHETTEKQKERYTSHSPTPTPAPPWSVGHTSNLKLLHYTSGIGGVIPPPLFFPSVGPRMRDFQATTFNLLSCSLVCSETGKREHPGMEVREARATPLVRVVKRLSGAWEYSRDHRVPCRGPPALQSCRVVAAGRSSRGHRSSPWSLAGATPGMPGCRLGGIPSVAAVGLSQQGA